MNKYCAFGIHYLDRKGEIIEESKNYYIVKSETYGLYKLALFKSDKLVKVFSTKEDRDKWINVINMIEDETFKCGCKRKQRGSTHNVGI